MEWFYEMKRWGRVYICFLLPAVIAGILFAFRQWIAAGVFLGIMIFILLPLFIDAEEELGKRRHEQIVDHLRRAAAAPPAKSHVPERAEPPAAPHAEETPAAQAPAAQLSSLWAENSAQNGDETPADLPYSLILAAKDNANILIAKGDRGGIQARIDELSELIRSAKDRESQYRFSIERDALTRYLTEPRDDKTSH